MSKTIAPASRPSQSASVAASAPEPQHGDIVVVRTPGIVPPFGVRQVPAAVQFGATIRDEAVRIARSYARLTSVDLWYSDDGLYRLLERYRPAARRD